VIVADSRGHGRTEIGAGQLTYEQMAEDYYALMGHLKISNWNVLGWSDGGIIGLLLEINHPGSANKLAIMGANLKPEAAYDWAREWVTVQKVFYSLKSTLEIPAHLGKPISSIWDFWENNPTSQQRVFLKY
jgi:pimeloyl-ACP methyl ester carboxylesterase